VATPTTIDGIVGLVNRHWVQAKAVEHPRLLLPRVPHLKHRDAPHLAPLSQQAIGGLNDLGILGLEKVAHHLRGIGREALWQRRRVDHHVLPRQHLLAAGRRNLLLGNTLGLFRPERLPKPVVDTTPDLRKFFHCTVSFWKWRSRPLPWQ